LTEFNPETAEQPQTSMGPSAEYCPTAPNDGHHMVSRSAGKLVRWVEICSQCGWIDAAALDGWAENAIKLNLSERAQNIALAAGTEPFTFVTRTGEDQQPEPLALEEILAQALGAASMCWVERPKGEFNGSRAKAVYDALWMEVGAAMLKDRKAAIESIGLQLKVDIASRLGKLFASAGMETLSNKRILAAVWAGEPGGVEADPVREWSDLAYELWAFACNSQASDVLDSVHKENWTHAFARLNERFHGALKTLPHHVDFAGSR
jgi:hypothetical protein